MERKTNRLEDQKRRQGDKLDHTKSVQGKIQRDEQTKETEINK